MGGCVYIEWSGEAAGEMLLMTRAAHIPGMRAHTVRDREVYGAERRVFVPAGVYVLLARIRNS